MRGKGGRWVGREGGLVNAMKLEQEPEIRISQQFLHSSSRGNIESYYWLESIAPSLTFGYH